MEHLTLNDIKNDLVIDWRPIHIDNKQIIYSGSYRTYFYDYKNLTFKSEAYHHWHDKDNIYHEYHDCLWKVKNNMPIKKIQVTDNSNYCIHVSNNKVYIYNNGDKFDEILVCNLDLVILDKIEIRQHINYVTEIRYMHGKLYLWFDTALFSIDLKSKKMEYVYKDVDNIFNEHMFNGILVVRTQHENTDTLYILSKTYNEVQFPLGFYDDDYNYNNHVIIMKVGNNDTYMIYNHKMQVLYTINNTKEICEISNKYIVYKEFQSEKFPYWIKKNILKTIQNNNYFHIWRLF